MDFEYDGIVDCGDTKLRLPRGIQVTADYGNDLILTLYATDDGVSEPDVTIDERGRNVLRVRQDCQIRWIVEAPPSSSGDEHHEMVYVLGDRIVSKSDEGIYHEISPSTGNVVDSWPGTAFKIGESLIEFDGNVSQPRCHQGTYFLRVKADPDSCDLYAFDSDATELWHRRDRYDWMVEAGESGLVVRDHVGRRADYVFRLDSDTGVVTETIHAPADVERRVEAANPE